jgi:arsenite methyltransferase
VNITNIRDAVKEKYGQAALRVRGKGASCCGASSASDSCNPITSNLYDTSEAGSVPEEAMLASLGCGNLSDRAEVLTSCCPRGVSPQPERLTGWI